MKKIIMLFLVLCLSLSGFASTKLISDGWKFSLSDKANYKNPNFDDSSWRELNVPHDWALEEGYSKYGAQKEQGGYAVGGVAWYRKSLVFTKEELANKHIFIDFDGVYMNSEVWVNGNFLGKRAYGYISFSYELSEFLKEGENIISVRVDCSKEPSARWYHACGIYGNVHLRSKMPTYFEKDGTFIRTSEISQASAKIDISSEIVSKNLGKASLELIVFNGEKEEILRKTLPISLAEGLQNIDIDAKVLKPKLWSPESPNLYLAKLNILDDKSNVLDVKDIPFGVRSIEWQPEKGFFLNGKQYKLQGVCEHLEGGATGGFSSEKLWRSKIQLLKDMGCNAIRTSHNPFLPEFYSLCDEMGMLVFDEIFDGWIRKAKFDYAAIAFEKDWQKDLSAFIRRDRNHPSVFLYSVGNETRGKIAKDLVSLCHDIDPTRLVTAGSSENASMDIDGWNGGSEKEGFVEYYKLGAKSFLGTEYPHTWQVRGFYRTLTWYRNGYPNPMQKPLFTPDLTEKEIFTYDWTSPSGRKNPKQVFTSSYDNATARINVRQSIEYMKKYDWFSGGFRWTGFDYRGEAGYVHGGFPFRAFMGGIIDLAGFPKDHYFLYQSEWTNVDMVHLLPHWTHPKMKKGTLVPVHAYTTGDEAELFFNKKSLGKKQKGDTWEEMLCEWLVPWKAGTLEVVAYRNGKEIARTSQKTANAPSRLDISLDESLSESEISIMTIKQVDDAGTVYPYGENRVYVKIFGDANVLSFENGDPVDVENNYNASSKKCFFGLNRIFIQPTKKSQEDASMVLAVISGDKKLMQSDMISIDVQEVSLRGKPSAKNLEIRYTLDGSQADKNSTLYKGAFPIKLDTTVNATVYDGDVELFKMQERFAEDEGLYWGE